MSGRAWDQVIAEDLRRLRETHLYRLRQVTTSLDSTHVERNGRRYINFASNDYLGLTHHPKVLTAAREGMERFGFGSGAAPLISGYGPAHQSAERTIAAWKGTESAVLLPSGYQANHAAIQTAAAIGRLSGGVRFLADKLAHASLIDAIRSTGEELRVFPHNHIPKLRRLLEEAPEHPHQVVVTESIFSMDGDAADLTAIAELKATHSFMLVLDEAHATGVYGATGEGLAAEMGLREAVDVSVMTLSKALGGVGGAVCSSELFCQALVNHGRAYLFSTSMPASVAAAAEAAIDVIRSEPARREHVRELARSVRSALGDMGFEIPAGDSPIIPIILCKEQAALKAADRLRSAGLLVVAVRPPTVPRGSSRLRLTLSSEHKDEEVQQLLTALHQLRSTV